MSNSDIELSFTTGALLTHVHRCFIQMISNHGTMHVPRAIDALQKIIEKGKCVQLDFKIILKTS